MKLLQVPTANLEERIKEELEENPALKYQRKIMMINLILRRRMNLIATRMIMNLMGARRNTAILISANMWEMMTGKLPSIK
jgi:DNA-directed RNA polymerase specialized sigma54-like protein